MQKKLFMILLLVIAMLLCSCNASQPTPLPPAPETNSTIDPLPESTQPEQSDKSELEEVVTPEAPSSEEEEPTLPNPEEEIEPTPPSPPEEETEPTPPPPSEEEEAPPPAEEDEEEPTPVLHTDLYLPDYTAEQIIEYFEEVVLDVEYSDGAGDIHLVQKWMNPLYYRFYGSPTDTDKEVLNALFEQLNAIPGFPGIYYSETESQVNVTLNFLNEADFNESFSSVIGGEYAYGAVQFWYYLANNEIHTARIGYRTDIDQSDRNSVLIEEIINMLGISDTLLRPDSITYQYSNENMELSDVDLVILALLYHPSIQCGMNAESCAEVIRELYY